MRIFIIDSEFSFQTLNFDFEFQISILNFDFWIMNF